MGKRNRGNAGNNEVKENEATEVAQSQQVAEVQTQSSQGANTMSKIQQVQTVIYTTEDGTQFTSLQAAEAHQSYLENKDKIENMVQSYLNKMELVGRQRKIHETIGTALASFLVTWDGKFVERTVQEPVAEAPEAESEEMKEAAQEAAELENFDE